MVKKFIKDSLKYWAKEYKIDGYRFDLMALIDRETVGEIVAELREQEGESFLIYDEPWMGGQIPLKGIHHNGIVLTAQGIPFIQAGEELLKTKYGDHNSFRSLDEINLIDWSNKDRYKKVVNYYSGLIKMRKAHPAFRMINRADIKAYMKILKANDQVIAYRLDGKSVGDSWEEILVIYNGSKKIKELFESLLCE